MRLVPSAASIIGASRLGVQLRRRLHSRLSVKGSVARHQGARAGAQGAGFVILVRHGATFRDQADTDPFNLTDVAKQRNLNDKGKPLAKAFGEAIRAAGVPVGESIPGSSTVPTKVRGLGRLPNIEYDRDLSEGGLV